MMSTFDKDVYENDVESPKYPEKQYASLHVNGGNTGKCPPITKVTAKRDCRTVFLKLERIQSLIKLCPPLNISLVIQVGHA